MLNILQPAAPQKTGVGMQVIDYVEFQSRANAAGTLLTEINELE